MDHKKKIFNSVDNKHQIETHIIENISWFNINKLDFEIFKTFLILLKDVMMYMKNNNVLYIRQYITEEDTMYFKKSSVVNLDENTYVVTTNIADFIDEIIEVFGVKKL